MKLVQVTIKSKKNGKEYDGFRAIIGEYESPVFFPSKIETLYLKEFIAKNAHEEFDKDGD